MSIRMCEVALKKNPNDGVYLYKLANIYFEMRTYDEALKHFVRLYDIDKQLQKESVLLSTAECYYRLNKIEEALKCLNTFDQINAPKEFYLSKYRRGKCLDKMSKYK